MKKSLSLLLGSALLLGSSIPLSCAPLAQKADAPLPGRQNSVHAMLPQTKRTPLVNRLIRDTQVEGIHHVKSAVSINNRRAMRSATVAKAAMSPNIDLRGVWSLSDSWEPWAGEYGMYHVPFTQDGAMVKIKDFFNRYDIGYDDNNGNFYAVSFEEFWGEYDIFLDVYDTETWTRKSHKAVEKGMAGTAIALDPTTGDVYGCFNNDDLSGMVWGKGDFVNRTRTKILDIDGSYVAVGCSKQGQYYGVTNEGLFGKIDKATGEFTLIADTGTPSKYFCDGAVDDKDGVFVYVYCTETESGVMTLDLTTGAAEKVHTFTGLNQINGVHIAKPAAEDKAPGVPVLSVSCPEGAMQADIVLTMSGSLFDGTPATGQSFNYEITADGTSIATGSALAGETVNISKEIATQGVVKFVAVVSNSEGAAPAVNAECFIGKGTPKAPANVKLSATDTEFNLTWDAVTESADGGYMDAAGVTYTITDAQGTVLAEGITGNSWSSAYTQPDNFTLVKYGVRSVYGDNASATVSSNACGIGAYSTPLAMDMNNRDNFDSHTVVNANNDGSTWTFVNAGRTRYTYSDANQADDWIISPNIRLEAGKVYLYKAEVLNQGAFYPERIEIKMGQGVTAEAMTTTLVEPTVVSSYSYQNLEVSSYLRPEADGTYNIGVHAISDPNSYYLYLVKYSVSAALSAAAPAPAENVSAEGDPTGLYKAVVKFSVPTKSVTGAGLTGDVNVKVIRGYDTVIKEQSVAPGTSVELTDDTMTSTDTYTYTIKLSNADGEEALPVKVSAFVGPKDPAALTNVKLTQVDNTTLKLDWDPVTSAVDGTPIPAENITYNVYKVVNTGQGLALDSTPLNAQPLTVNTFTTDAVDFGTEQDFTYLGVIAYNRDVNGQAAIGYCLTGDPYQMPVRYTNAASLQEHFMSYGGQGSFMLGNATTFADITAVDGDGEFYAIRNVDTNGIAGPTYIETGKIVVSGDSPAIIFHSYNSAKDSGTQDSNLTHVSVITADGETEIGVIDNAEESVSGWYRRSFGLEQFVGQEVQVRLTTEPKTHIYNCYDNIRVAQDVANDLSVDVEIPDRVTTDKEFEITAKVYSCGYDDCGAFTVKLFRNGELIDAVDVDGLACDEFDTYSFTTSLTRNEPETSNFHVVVECADDKDLSNNTTDSYAVTRNISKLPTVTGLTGVGDDGKITLTWEAADLGTSEPERITEDFESGDSFADEFYGWTFVDPDNAPRGGFAGVEVPGHPQESAFSFFIFDSSYPDFNDTFAAKSGTKYLAALYRKDGEDNNDWAISPVLSGEAQTVSFAARAYNGAEKVELWYSTLENPTLDDFVKCEDLGTRTLSEWYWSTCTAELPEGARRMAIRCVSSYSLMVKIDDVTFTRMSGLYGVELQGYNVYCDGKKITETPVSDPTHSYLSDGVTHTYNVTAVYNTGESEFSAPVTVVQSALETVDAAAASIRVVGHTICVDVDADAEVAVYAADGRLMRSARGPVNITVAPAVYVVKAGTLTRKVIVK